ncbi:hypothetical protein [Chlorobaculum limnaeum]|nr:hypothetical protein [Chlorobaculum limnaeum]
MILTITKGNAMYDNSREPLDLLDQMYTVAYWMTGSLKQTNNLVYKTYQLVDSETTEVQLFKTFREVFYEHFCFGMTSLKSHQACENEEYTEFGKYTQEVDGQFAVLLAEVCKMKHQAISKILDQPVEKIRLLLTSRRKSMLAGFLNLALYCCMDIHYT